MFREILVRRALCLKHKLSLRRRHALALRENRRLRTTVDSRQNAIEVQAEIIAQLKTRMAEYERRIAELERYSDIDILTGLFNRQGEERRFLSRISIPAREPQDITVAACVLDLDNFKEVNDRLGHKEGDAVLRRVAELVRASYRRGDLIARPMGDEFHVYLPNADAAQAALRAATLLELIERDPELQAHGITGSIGVTSFVLPGTVRSAETILELRQQLCHEADQAMYAAKAQGKNTFHVDSDAGHVFQAAE